MNNTVHLNDDLVPFLEDLREGRALSLLAAPAAEAAIEDFPRLLGYLRSLGVRAVYPVLPYADITVWAYDRLLKENPRRTMISSACAGINRRITEHPGEWAEYLCPVFSPLLCTARYLRTYRRLTDSLAFLSPCTLKKKEFTTGNEDLIQYNVTIKSLNHWIKSRGIALGQYEACYPEQDPNGPGITLAAFGGIGQVLAALLPDLDFHVEQGIEKALSYLLNNREFGGKNRPCLFEGYACPGGCANGSGVGPCGGGGENQNFLACREKTDPQTILKLFAHYDRTLKPKDFCRSGG
jgi:iron only hydrogenase large subunit-like protein